MTERMTYRWLWSCLIAGGLLLLTGCTDNFEEVQQPSPVPEPQPEEGDMLELRAVTRTSGAYQIPTTENPATSVQLFLYTLSPTNENPNHYTAVNGMFSYSGNYWSSSSAITVKEETQYYLYGYMPSSVTGSVSADDLNDDYSKGVDLTLSNLPAITTDDIGVLVGVQRVGSTTTEAPNVKEGQYGFRSGIKGENFLNLLMAHLYARVKLSFKIDPAYAELRSIDLKDVKLTTAFGPVKAVVNLRDKQGIGTPTFTTGTTQETVTLYTRSNTHDKVLSKDSLQLALNIPAYCTPLNSTSGTYNLTLRTEYDVSDRGSDGHRRHLGERTSVNTIKLSAALLLPGKERNITLTVKPTYLYILSDNDLDNPTIIIN